jgi:hypothetical protein
VWTPIAPHIEAFLRETLSQHRGASQRLRSSAHEGFTDIGNVLQQIRCSLEIPVGRVDVDMTQVGCQGGHVLTDAPAIRRAGAQRPHRECMTKIVQARTATGRRSPKDQFSSTMSGMSSEPRRTEAVDHARR